MGLERVQSKPPVGTRVAWIVDRARIVSGVVVGYASVAVALVQLDTASVVPEQTHAHLAGWDEATARRDRIWPFLWLELRVEKGTFNAAE